MIERICPKCKVPMNGERCIKPGCGCITEMASTVYWCDSCNIPVFEKCCPTCGNITTYLSTDLRPVFPEENLLISIIFSSKISSLYVSYFAFSMLVRYNPDGWRNICDSADITIIRKLLVHCKAEMMSEILNLLFDEQFYFSTEVKPIKEEIDYDKIYEEIKKRFRDEKYRTGGRSDIF